MTRSDKVYFGSLGVVCVLLTLAWINHDPDWVAPAIWFIWCVFTFGVMIGRTCTEKLKTGDGVFTVPKGVTTLKIEMTGGGGGGAGSGPIAIDGKPIEERYESDAVESYYWNPNTQKEEKVIRSLDDIVRNPSGHRMDQIGLYMLNKQRRSYDLPELVFNPATGTFDVKVGE